jgi:hypothetical protein
MEAKVQINDALVKINEVYDYYANELVRYYELVNKDMVNFFQDYKMVDTLN